MELKTKVKVGHVTSLSEARYCAGMGVDFLGFPFWDDYENDFERFINISSWISGPTFVLECLYESDFNRVVDEQIAAEYIQVELDYINIEKLGDYKLFILLPDTLTGEMIDKLLSLSGKGHSVLVTLEGWENNNHHLAGFSIYMEEGEEEWQQSLDTLLCLPIDGIFIRGINEEEAPGIQNYDHLTDILQRLQVNED